VNKYVVDLYDAGHSSEESLRLCDYLAYGPRKDLETYKLTLLIQTASFDSIFYAIRSVDIGKVCG